MQAKDKGWKENKRWDKKWYNQKFQDKMKHKLHMAREKIDSNRQECFKQ